MVNKHKNWKLLTSAAVLTSAFVAPAAVFAAPTYFKDVPTSHPAYDSIMYLTGEGIIHGYPDGTFRPSANVTRGQAAKILASSLKLDLSKVRNPYFKDVPTTHSYYKYIAALSEAGIIDGYPNGYYGVNDPLTRAQMAKILSLAYQFDKQPLRTSRFTDVPANAYYAVYLQSLLDNKITYGVSPTRFAPNQYVDRSQMARFVHRSELATNQSGTVNATISYFDGYSLQTDKGTFDIPYNLRAFFSANNYNALRNAKITFNKDRNSITSITLLELRNSGTASSPVTLYGNNAVFNGDITVDADYVTIKDLTISKNLSFGYGAQNNFTADSLSVKGTTSINDLPYSSTKTLNFNFNYSTLNTIQLSKPNTNLTFSNRSSAQSITLKANSTVRMNDTSRINDFSIEGATTEAAIYGTIPKISVSTTRDFKLNGSGAITTFNIKTNRLVSINTSGTISTLDIPSNGDVDLSNQTYVTNAQIPRNTSIRNVIRNYDSAKYRIEKINGSKNPDHTPPYTPPPVYPDINIKSATMNTDGIISMTFDQQPTKLNMTTKTALYPKDDKTNLTLELANLSIKNGSYTKGEAGTFSWNEGSKRFSTTYSVVSVNGNWKTVTFYDDVRLSKSVFEITYRVTNYGLEIDSDFTEDKVTYLNNTTFSILGTKGSFRSIAGSKITVPITNGNVTNESELQKALSAKLSEINIMRDITLTTKLSIDYPSVKINTTKGATIKVSEKLSYGTDEAAIQFTENAKNAKWQNLTLVGHSNTRGHGIIVESDGVLFDNAEITNFEGFNIVSNNTSSISLNKVKLSNSAKGGLQVSTSGTSSSTVNLTNVETSNNQFGGINLVTDRKNSKIIVNGNGNQHNDRKLTPDFWTNESANIDFKLTDFNLYTTVGNDYYNIDSESEFTYAYSQLIKMKTQTPKINIGNDFTTDKPLHLNEAISINGNGKTITLNSNGRTKRHAEGLQISSTVVIDNLNLTSGKDMKDYLIEVNGNGASLALTNSILKDSNLGAIYVGDSSKRKETKEKLILKGNIDFTNNVLGGVGAINGVTIEASDAKIAYTPSKQTDNIIYTNPNRNERIIADPIFWAESVDVTFVLPKEFKEPYGIYRDKRNNKILADNKNSVTEVIYSR